MTTQSSATMSAVLNKMLSAKGFKAADEEVGTILNIEGKNYIVSMKKTKKVFEEYNEDLDEEEYDIEEPEEEKAIDTEDETAQEEVKTKNKAKKTPATKAKQVDTEDDMEEPEETENETETVQEEVKTKAKKTPATKAKQVDTEEEEVKEKTEKKVRTVKKAKKLDTEDEETEQKKKGKKTNKTKKADGEEDTESEGKKKKRRDPSKPKRTRERTCHNMFVSEMMLVLKSSMPELSGRDRFREVNKRWSELPQDEKDARKAKFNEEKEKLKAEAIA